MKIEMYFLLKHCPCDRLNQTGLYSGGWSKLKELEKRRKECENICQLVG